MSETKYSTNEHLPLLLRVKDGEWVGSDTFTKSLLHYAMQHAVASIFHTA